ncbi:MAG TPA: hypothetical protein DIT93_11015 [Pelagibacterium sp.]|uniref:CidA/LrgA family protein n=1 Tax=uncultured Pelagibacterium sp. TaxID=1159875 RepID=UPI000ECAC7CB|nr:hypothetical protein [Pelagibacterium sp.]|tara:strand:+ start:857 stop:1234 length:378 start_codon:yes stop_codon:yes gene_type:complete
MLLGLFVLLACQLGGDIVTRALSLPVPGPVIGILLLLGVMVVARYLPKRDRSVGAQIETAAESLLGWLGLFFVPAGVGISQHFDLVAANGLALTLVLVVSSVLTLAVTVWVFILARRLFGARGNG